MNWELIGAIGELIGGLAVLITLIYLARQIKHSSNTNEAEIFNTALDAFHNWRKLTIEHAEILTRFEEGETLSASETLIARTISLDFAFATAANFSTTAIHDPERMNLFTNLMVLQLKSNRLAHGTWPEAKLLLTTSGFGDFVSAVEAELLKASS